MKTRKGIRDRPREQIRHKVTYVRETEDQHKIGQRLPCLGIVVTSGPELRVRGSPSYLPRLRLLARQALPNGSGSLLWGL